MLQSTRQWTVPSYSDPTSTVSVIDYWTPVTRLFIMYCCSNRCLPGLVLLLLVAASEGGGHLFGLDHLHTIQNAVLIHVENEQRDTKVLHRHNRILQQHSASASITAKGNNEPESFDLHAICQVIEHSFSEEYNVTCSCAGNVIDNLSIACDYMKPICRSKSNTTTTTETTCGIPQIAISMVKQQIFSSTTCIHNYTRNNILQSDTCVFVDTCANTKSSTDISSSSSSTTTTTATNRELFHPKFCDCTASYGNEICNTCQICPGMNAINVDCSNINAQAVSSNTCSEIDLDLHLSPSSDEEGTSSSSSSTMAGFAPDFAGFCTQLEDSMNNTISCDCTNAIGGSYNISCNTNDRVCIHDDDVHCGTVNSTVAVVDGTIHTVTACAAYDTEPFNIAASAASPSTAGSGVTCTTMHLCNGNDSSESDNEEICSCSATYDDQSCNSCTVIRRDASTTDPHILPDQTYITIDCSNVNSDAITETPQPIYGSNSYEFLPYYSRTINDDISFDNSSSSSSRINISLASLLSTIVWAVCIIFITTRSI